MGPLPSPESPVMSPAMSLLIPFLNSLQLCLEFAFLPEFHLALFGEGFGVGLVYSGYPVTGSWSLEERGLTIMRGCGVGRGHFPGIRGVCALWAGPP